MVFIALPIFVGSLTVHSETSKCDVYGCLILYIIAYSLYMLIVRPNSLLDANGIRSLACLYYCCILLVVVN